MRFMIFVLSINGAFHRLTRAVLHQYFHRCFRTGMRLNASCISLVYGKSLRIASAGA
jgi:hypothetical protein